MEFFLLFILGTILGYVVCAVLFRKNNSNNEGYVFTRKEDALDYLYKLESQDNTNVYEIIEVPNGWKVEKW